MASHKKLRLLFRRRSGHTERTSRGRPLLSIALKPVAAARRGAAACFVFSLRVTAAVAPPKELFTEFRVLVDSGEVMTDQGVVNLERGSTHYLRRSDGEHLARQGLVEPITQEEAC